MTREWIDCRVRSAKRMVVVVTILACALGLSPAIAAAQRPIDTGRSTITVRVFKTGFFKVFADNHEVVAPIASGAVNEGPAARVQLIVDARRMQVVDPGLSAQDRASVQSRMLGSEVLDVDRFAEIRFESTVVEPVESDGWLVHGRLTLHGQTRPILVKVMRDQDRFRGSVSLNQTSFGITPVRVAAGAVAVKDQVMIDFDIVLGGTPRD